MTRVRAALDEIFLGLPYLAQPLVEDKNSDRSKKEPPHNRDGTPCGELSIPYNIDLMWSCARRKTPKTWKVTHTSPAKLCQVKQQIYREVTLCKAVVLSPSPVKGTRRSV